MWLNMLCGVAAMGSSFFLFPRNPSWQIVELEFSRFSLNATLHADLVIRSVINIMNPNYVAANVRALDIELLHHNIYGELSPFANLNVSKAFRLPARGEKHLESTIIIDDLPSSTSFAMLHSMATREGQITILARGISIVRAVFRNMRVGVNCVEHVRATSSPAVITHSTCSYHYFKR